MNKQKEKEIYDLYRTLGIDDVGHVKYTFSEGEIGRGNLINSDQRKKKIKFLATIHQMHINHFRNTIDFSTFCCWTTMVLLL
ncbi:MAG: hypothetical protein ACLR56_06690 [Oscillospiraceae bacterium]